MKKLPVIVALATLSTAMSFSADASIDNIIKYQLSNPGAATCSINGKQVACPSDINLQIKSAAYNTSTQVFQFTPQDGNALTFPAFVQKKTQNTTCISETGDGPTKLIPCSNFGYPTTKGTKNFKQTFKVLYNNPLIQMSFNDSVYGLTTQGKQKNGSVKISNIIFSPAK